MVEEETDICQQTLLAFTVLQIVDSVPGTTMKQKDMVLILNGLLGQKMEEKKKAPKQTYIYPRIYYDLYNI